MYMYVHVHGGRAIHIRTSRKRSASRGSSTRKWGSCYTRTYLQEEVSQAGVVLEFQGESSQKLHLVCGYRTEVGLSTRTNQPLEGMEHMCADVTAPPPSSASNLTSMTMRIAIYTYMYLRLCMQSVDPLATCRCNRYENTIILHCVRLSTCQLHTCGHTAEYCTLYIVHVLQARGSNALTGLQIGMSL